MLKKFIAITLAAFMIFALCACGESEPPINKDKNNQDSQAQSGESETTTEPLKIVSTIFPQYDWVREIIGEKSNNFELILLADSAADLHSYDPSIADILTISKCDLFIYVGGHSDDWVEDVLKTADNPDMLVINLMEELGDAVKMERLTEGQEHVCDEECEEEHDEDGELIFHEDEHVWTSLKNTQLLCSPIADAVVSLDPENEDVYRENFDDYIGRLSSLDAKYQDAVASAEADTLVFADRFPFLYLVDDYALTHYAAFTGCAAESEAAISTIVILARKIDELGLGMVMVTESSDKAIAETIISNTESRNQQILVLNAMQSVTADDIKNGVTYLSIMESNLEVLKEALG